jgi:predicted RNA binding protein with dsRBD fold (UPF0201 family)
VRVQLQGRVKIYPTEDSDKVRQAAGNLFPLAKMELAEEDGSKVLTFKGEGRESLTRLQAVLRQEHIRDSVRRVLHEKIEGDRIRFCLNKQVAYVGRVSICEPSGESPLGPIEVEIETDDPQSLINWLSPASPT